MTQKARACYVGDLLQSDLTDPRIYDRVAGAVGGEVIHGLFAALALPRSDNQNDLARAATDVGFDVALSVISRVPYGKYVKAIVNAGRKASEIYQQWQEHKSPPPVLPWAEYSRDLDENFVTLFLAHEAQGVDWTPLFGSPFGLSPWQFAWRTASKDGGVIFAPVKSGKVDWNSNFGCMPGTSGRVFGQTQASFPIHDGPGGNSSSPLRRRVDAPAGVTPRHPILPWKMDVSFAGDYLPALGQLGQALWQQCLGVGPAMYRIDCTKLLSDWRSCSDNLFATGFASLPKVTQQLKAGAGGLSYLYMQVIASQLIEPYIAVKRTPMSWAEVDDTWILGDFPDSPRPNPIVHPQLFTDGPVEKGHRSAAAWFDRDLPREEWAWPYGQALEQDWKRLATWQGMGSSAGGPLVGLDAGNPSSGFRAQPWPFPEVEQAIYRPFASSITDPAILNLQIQQVICLNRIFSKDIDAGGFDPRMLLSAYVRPDANDDGPAYGAFKSSPTLPKLCLDARKELVRLIKAGHPARDIIDLRDAATVDGAFAAQLKAAGAPDKPTKAPPKDGEPPPDDPPARPQGGLPFDKAPRYGLLWGEM